MDDVEVTDALASELTQFVWGMARRLRLEGAGSDGLTLSQTSILVRLVDGRPRTNAELAREESVTPQSMNANVRELLAAGLLQRVSDESDKRLKRLSLTDEGRRVMMEARRQRAEWLTLSLKERFSPKQQQELVEAVHQLAQVLDGK